ncbi:MAG: hypothetical protein A2268_02730 [Candidatus Raymondbacteria bacterium RifOxyA12_full_50_37]|uniref:Probable endonuclease 4 n=1 Tax=Candidatus Raymondbacteria bacterium RIFOXYD12_FULL_49_13 TaxID=1817890 RepID=A0A1F7FJ67_UNCRA|nr:MAG: hypothetical protein A2268_02730 [Candidatus Raymondbacteria bacterium RifOxyA12_full_50_37]OGJ90600.1 MAG: hypothetical protein A2248_02390 [Candidatus Raymondbacteria bacterium RIFOXYA2_FULL_49_16]OGK02409.1 MAG: hypothetical protein A2350_13520 [Candidatus Raymondbacteria bacterium RifOxyB12_full_50_8]OGK06138.1 MAG: hypothetical protein A2487_18850 [Candidatus Raymondbacteria bacterium RifOxyC12_full_50_8]OGK06720.1 MAG: hypothetical protein A2519_21550 [Candidatus Raymondbacteria b
MVLLGAHVSASGGVSNAPLNGKNLGCTAIQLFSKNQRQWSAPPLSDDETAAYFTNLKASGIVSVVAHDTYLINLGSPDTEMREKSLHAVIDEIKRANKLKLNGIVFHPGSHMGAGDAQGIRFVVSSLNRAVDETPDCTAPILIETTAGQGTNLGHTFEHIRDMLAGVKDKSRFGVCYDTCHTFCAGYDIRTAETYKATMEKFNSIIGLSNLKCIHMNDTDYELGSKKDRHQNIGKGVIGKAAFGFFMNDPRFQNVPKILETPGGDEWYARDLKTLKGLMKTKVKAKVRKPKQNA